MTDYRIGDVVNGHVLIRRPDGALTWAPLAPEPVPAPPATPAPADPWRRDLFGVYITAASLWWRIPAAIITGLIMLAMFSMLGPLTTVLIIGAGTLACYALGKAFRQD